MVTYDHYHLLMSLLMIMLMMRITAVMVMMMMMPVVLATVHMWSFHVCSLQPPSDHTIVDDHSSYPTTPDSVAAVLLDLHVMLPIVHELHAIWQRVRRHVTDIDLIAHVIRVVAHQPIRCYDDVMIGLCAIGRVTDGWREIHVSDG